MFFFDFQTEVNFIVFLGICVISILLISNSYLAFMTSVITYFSNMLTSRLQIRLLENYLMQPYSFFLDRNTSDLGKNILLEVPRVTNGFIMQLLLGMSKIIIALFLFSGATFSQTENKKQSCIESCFTANSKRKTPQERRQDIFQIEPLYFWFPKVHKNIGCVEY